MRENVTDERMGMANGRSRERHMFVSAVLATALCGVPESTAAAQRACAFSICNVVECVWCADASLVGSCS